MNLHRSRFVATAAALMLVLMALPPAALAQSSPPAGPTPLSSTAGGTVSPGGTAYYSLAYPGGSLSATVTMSFSPTDLSGAIGMSLVGSQGEIPAVVQCVSQDAGTVTNTLVVTPPGASSPVTVLAPGTQKCTSNQTVMTASLTQYAAETYQVKIYNRNQSVTLSYSLSLSGIPLPCQPDTAAGGPTPAQASVLGKPVTSQLAARPPQGTFSFYHFHYAGDNSNLMLVMFYNPTTDWTRNGGVGFNVYRGSDLVTKGGTSPSDGQLFAAYQSQTPDDYYVQVYNYTDQLINYTLSLSGLPCPAPATAAPPQQAAPTADGKTSDTAILFGGSDQRALGGNSIGSFVWYHFPYDGQSQPNISMTFSPSDPQQSSGTGFNLYGPNSLWIKAGGTGGGPGTIGVTLQSSAPPGDYYIQVYNYITGSTVNYTLTRS